MKKIFIIIGITLLSVVTYAQTIIPLPSGGTWTTSRARINSNDELLSNSIAILQATKAPIASPTLTDTVSLPSTWRVNTVSITSNGQELNILDGALVTYAELNKLVGISTDTIATRAYARLVGGSGGVAIADVRDEISDSLRLYLSVADTSAMLDSYALLSEVGEGASMVYPSGSGIPIVASGASWGTTITNNSTVWNRAGVVGNGTAPPYFDGSSDGGQMLYFYGNNGFYTALQGGAPTANRSYRLPIAALPSAGTTQLINIDEYGNMGFTTGSAADSSVFATRYYTGLTYLGKNSTAAAVDKYTPASGSLTLIGGDAITFTTSSITGLSLPTSGILASTADVRSIVSDSLQARLASAESGIALSDSTGNAIGNYVTRKALVDSIAASGGGADSSIYVTVTRLTDSLNVMRSLINDLIAAVGNLGLDLMAPTIKSLEIGTFADDTIAILFNEKMNIDSIPAASVFYLTEDANEMGIASISFLNDSVMYVVLDSAAIYGSTYLLDYTRDYSYIQDSTGNALANFTNKSVTNNMAQPETGPPSFLTSDGDTDAWFISDIANLTIQNTNQVAAWADESGNNRSLSQAVGGSRPIWNGTDVVFDNTDCYLINNSYTTAQPVTVYIVVEQTSPAGDGDKIFALGDFDVPDVRQGLTSSDISMRSSSTISGSTNIVNELVVITAIFNTSTSSLQVNDATPITGNIGNTGITGIMLSSNDNGSCAQKVKEFIIRSVVDDANEISQVKAYLNSKYSIN